MGKGNGFTVIEVIIFLAISGLLLTMALIGSGQMARQQRFTDSVNGLQSNLQREYESVASGVNIRSAADVCSESNVQPGRAKCVIMGRVLSFDETGVTVNSRPVTGVPAVETGTTYDQIQAAGPTIMDQDNTSFTLSWGATFQVASRASGVLTSEPAMAAASAAVPTPRAKINNLAFLRSPYSTQIVSYYFYSSGTSLGTVQTALTKAVLVASATQTASTTGAICIHNTADWSTNGPIAAITLSGTGSAGIDTNFQPTKGSTGVELCYN
ncbi:MAG: prepilin-type N-terminal cleavage/methylation domain-containing protein [Candidatus Saccharimonadales bacterium]|jgi:Tfp pilus assembly protein FimT